MLLLFRVDTQKTKYTHGKFYVPPAILKLRQHKLTARHPPSVTASECPGRPRRSDIVAHEQSFSGQECQKISHLPHFAGERKNLIYTT